MIVIFDAPNTFVVGPFTRSRFGAISDDEVDSSESASLCKVKRKERGGARAKGGEAGTAVPHPPPCHSLYTGRAQAGHQPQQVKRRHYPPKPAVDTNDTKGQIGPLTCLKHLKHRNQGERRHRNRGATEWKRRHKNRGTAEQKRHLLFACSPRIS